MDEDFKTSAICFRGVVSDCANTVLDKSSTYKEALSIVKNQRLFTSNPYSTELMDLVSDEIMQQALSQHISQ